MFGQQAGAAPSGPGGWWAAPPRSGMRRAISPWEYRHLRAWAGVRMAGGAGLTVLGVMTLALGGNDERTYGWAAWFLVVAAANFAFASWELTIAGSESARA